MTREKPPKCQEKVNIEANFFEIEMKLKELRQNPFVPPEGQRLPDIDQVKTEFDRNLNCSIEVVLYLVRIWSISLYSWENIILVF